AEIAGGSFEIETIPRTGYRLTGDIVRIPYPAYGPDEKAAVSRRGVIAGGTGVALLAIGGMWSAIRSRQDVRFDQLIEVGEAAIRTEDANHEIIRSLQEAAELRPNSARAWGLLAFFNI